jgi:hypothetical protein
LASSKEYEGCQDQPAVLYHEEDSTRFVVQGSIFFAAPTTGV